ncbi:MAG TPA: ABC transporter permease [Actinoplanes sp.]|nr:ABC transporter permease [Actinoplanes sp.]
MTVDEHTVTSPTWTRSGRWSALSGHAIAAFLRNRMAAFFTLVFPLTFLVIVAALVGDQRTETGAPVAQLLIAPFAVFGVAQASFTMLAVDTAALRESGVLMRLRGTPVSASTVIAARITAAAVASLAAVLLLTTAGAVFYGVDIVWHKLPALLVTLILGIACLAALGLALASLTRTVLAAQTLAQGILIPLAFISDVFIVGARLPEPLAVTGSLLPLKHLARAAAQTFQPGPGSGFSPGHLAVLAVWTVVGTVIAVRWFGWSPRGTTGPPSSTGTTAPAPVAALSAPRVTGPVSGLALLTGQVRYALLGLRRDLLSVFFTVVFPAVLLILFPSVFGDSSIHGVPMKRYLLAGMITYAIAVAGWVNLPESMAGARATGILKRLRGTPLPYTYHVAGRVLAALITALASALLLSVLAAAVFGVRLGVPEALMLLVAVLAGGCCFAALGLALVAVLPSARSVVAVTLGTLLPLCFVSEVFVTGPATMPSWLSTVADVFPLRHLLTVVLAAAEPDTAAFPTVWPHLGVIAAWAVAATAVVLVRARRPSS